MYATQQRTTPTPRGMMPQRRTIRELCARPTDVAELWSATRCLDTCLHLRLGSALRPNSPVHPSRRDTIHHLVPHHSDPTMSSATKRLIARRDAVAHRTSRLTRIVTRWPPLRCITSAQTAPNQLGITKHSALRPWGKASTPTLVREEVSG